MHSGTPPGRRSMRCTGPPATGRSAPRSRARAWRWTRSCGPRWRRASATTSAASACTTIRLPRSRPASWRPTRTRSAATSSSQPTAPRPTREPGRELLAHELAHVVQQRNIADPRARAGAGPRRLRASGRARRRGRDDGARAAARDRTGAPAPAGEDGDPAGSAEGPAAPRDHREGHGGDEGRRRGHRRGAAGRRSPTSGGS